MVKRLEESINTAHANYLFARKVMYENALKRFIRFAVKHAVNKGSLPSILMSQQKESAENVDKRFEYLQNPFDFMRLFVGPEYLFAPHNTPFTSDMQHIEKTMLRKQFEGLLKPLADQQENIQALLSSDLNGRQIQTAHHLIDLCLLIHNDAHNLRRDNEARSTIDVLKMVDSILNNKENESLQQLILKRRQVLTIQLHDEYTKQVQPSVLSEMKTASTKKIKKNTTEIEKNLSIITKTMPNNIEGFMDLFFNLLPQDLREEIDSWSQKLEKVNANAIKREFSSSRDENPNDYESIQPFVLLGFSKIKMLEDRRIPSDYVHMKFDASHIDYDKLMYLVQRATAYHQAQGPLFKTIKDKGIRGLLNNRDNTVVKNIAAFAIIFKSYFNKIQNNNAPEFIADHLKYIINEYNIPLALLDTKVLDKISGSYKIVQDKIKRSMSMPLYVIAAFEKTLYWNQRHMPRTVQSNNEFLNGVILPSNVRPSDMQIGQNQTDEKEGWIFRADKNTVSRTG